MRRVQLPYPGGKGRLAPRIVSFLPRRGRIYLEPFAGRANIFWEAVQQGLKFDRWWLNDLQTHTFLQAIKSHGDKVDVPVRSRRVFEYLRESYKRGEVMATLLAPHICYSGGLYESGVKGGSGCGDDDGGGSAAGFQRTLLECHRILNEIKPKITGLDWTKLRLEKLKGDDVVVLDPPYAFPLNITKTYSDDTLDYEQLVDVLLTAKFRWLLCGYPHPILHRLGAPIWARDMQLLCVRVKPGGEERSECIWTNFDPEAKRSQRFLPPSVKGQIKVIADAASLSFTALDERIDSGIDQVAKDFTALVPFLLEMHRRLNAPGRRTDLRRGAPNGLTWTAWVTSKRHKLGRGLRSIQYLLKGRTDASQHRLMLANARKNFANGLRCEPNSSISVNKVHCGDCLKLMGEMAAGSVDLIVTSPPYNLLNSTGNGMKDGFGGKWESAALADGYDVHDDGMPHQEYVKWQRECLTSMMRLLRDDGAIFYNHKWRVQDGLLQDRSDILKGFPVRQVIIWHRDGGLNFNDGYFLPCYEVVYLIAKPGFKLVPRANAVGDVWRISHERDNPHPAPFPVELAKRCIESTIANLILDPFMGSGTTAIAAEVCSRSWIGIEVSQHYCDMANVRIKMARKLKNSRPALGQSSVEPITIM